MNENYDYFQFAQTMKSQMFGFPCICFRVPIVLSDSVESEYYKHIQSIFNIDVKRADFVHI